ncbi:MAG: NADH dehydrogenase [Spirochaetes bacterium GWC1_27_15]|nr:MAG: NADH dehydrogenase [Spirochaetes bacterium GWB1_27_13]OHD27538.1 MAG: NADH dehydrogenase [Spirochaetes bacterium GWC1_27_15]
MGEKIVVPFGPQHPVLPEPIHLDLVLEDEKVVDAIPSIGYIHRGLELLTTKKEFTEYVYVAERICGICSFIHGQGYCEAIEKIMNIEVPRKALFLRTIWGEFSRIHSHLLWLGLAADAFGFENLFMQTWRIRELILDIMEETTGGRVIFGSCKIGGVRKDVDREMLSKMFKILNNIMEDLRETTDVFINDYSVKHRLVGVGVLSKELAYSLGAVGPMARASGIAIDMRKQGYAAYGELDFAPITDESGDCYGRCVVRIKEIFQSIDIIKQAISKVPDGAIDVKVTGTPSGEAFVRFEQPRGEVVYYVKANGTKFLDRFRARTPTFANIPPMVSILKGADFADVPSIILTIDPCISCTER